jgi:hypothetical protein
MNHQITPHEPEEALVSSVDEAFQDADASQRRWQEWEQKHSMKAVRIEVPEMEYTILEDLARRQGKTVPQIIQALLNGIMSTLAPSSQLHLKGSGGDR